MDKDELAKNIGRTVSGYLRALDSLGPSDWTNPEFTKRVYSLPEYQDVEALKSKIKDWIIENKGHPVVLPGSEKELVKEFIEMCRDELGEEIKDDPYSYFEIALDEFVDVQRILENVKKLEIPLLNRPVPIQYKGFIEEANRCYIYGFHRGCIAICRTVIETAIETAFKAKRKNIYQVTKIRSEEGFLAALINEAEEARILDQDTAESAHEIRRMANRYIHGSISVEHMNLEEDSYKAITVVSKVLQQIF